MKNYYVYIMTNKSNAVLYTGVTNNLLKRAYDHKNKLISGFTSRYNIGKLVYYDVFSNPNEAIIAEKRIKGWLRNKKIELVKSINPEFKDLLEYLRDSSLRSE